MTRKGVIAPLLTLVLYSCFTYYVGGEVVSGTIDTRQYAAYLGKFCVGSHGIARVSINPGLASGARLNVFLDEAWDKNMREMRVDCRSYQAAALQHVGLRPNTTQVFEVRMNEQRRPHFWFLTASHCTEEKDRDFTIDYNIHFQSTDGKWDHEFSYDQRGMYEVTVAFLLVMVVLFGVHIKLLTLWWAAEKWFPPIIKALTFTLVLQLGVTACQFVHLSVYITNGIGVPFLELIGLLGNAVATTLIMGLSIGIAKGRSFSDAEITKRFKLFIITIVFLLTVSYAALFLWDWLIRDPSSTLYIYESYPGYAILTIRVTTMGVFLYFLKMSYLEEFDDNRKSWYHVFGLLFVTWFLALPVIVFVSSIVSPWVREKTVYALEHIVQASAFTALVYFSHPSNAVGQFITVVRPFDEL